MSFWKFNGFLLIKNAFCLFRDQSDGIWNESQVTVLQVDSGTDNGTALSSSEMTSATSPGTTTSLLTPSSRRKHLLMLQHQQRSSFDTEALDEEIADPTDTCPRIVVEKTAKTAEPMATPPRQFLTVCENIPYLDQLHYKTILLSFIKGLPWKQKENVMWPLWTPFY